VNAYCQEEFIAPLHCAYNLGYPMTTEGFPQSATPDRDPDLIALAKSVNRARLEWDEAHAPQSIKIDDAMSRLLEHDPDYTPPRPRKADKKREPSKDIGVLTMMRIARRLDRTVGSLLGEVDDVLTPSDRAKMIEFADWLRDRAERREREMIGALDNLRQFPGNVRRDGDFPAPPIPIDEWILKDTDRPQPLHAGTKPIAGDAAAGLPINPDDDSLIPQAQLLNSILREIRDPRINVIRVAGHSMHPVLRNGWLILVDPARALFQPGRVVMVYIKDEGTTLGLLAKSGSAYKIVKRNESYGGPSEIALRDGEWYPIGTATRVVDAPIEIE
jgi:phage repressor protein C with HTH and peptisase S24 domain